MKYTYLKLKPLMASQYAPSNRMMEEYLNAVWCYLANKYGASQASKDLNPLSWYVGTDRAPREFCKAIYLSEPFMIRRKLHEIGSQDYDAAIDRICNYIGFDRCRY